MFFKKKEKANKLRKIEKNEHNIDKKSISHNALKVVNHLNSVGYEGYIVGGAVRDLVLNRIPKDFDVVTNATPNQIRKAFRNARVVGRRFRLAHIYFGDEIIETATFRSESKGVNGDKLITRDNRYGSIEEDATRRDFSINALYYDPKTELLLDFVDGFNDLQKKVIRTLKKEKISFLEDPVRMLRAVKYAVLTGSKLSSKTESNIKKHSDELKKCSSNRLHEEVNKIFRSGYGAKVFEELHRLNLLSHILSFLDNLFLTSEKEGLLEEMAKFDSMISQNVFTHVELYWLLLIRPYLVKELEWIPKESILYVEKVNEVFENIFLPVNVPRKLFEQLAKAYILFERFNDVEMIEKVRKNRHQYAYKYAQMLFVLWSDIPEVQKAMASLQYAYVPKETIKGKPKKNYTTSNRKNKNIGFVETKKHKFNNTNERG